MIKVLCGFVAVLLLAISTAAQEQKAPATVKELAPAQLEEQFKASLTNATLSGRWTPIKDGELGAEKEDKYRIAGVSKVSGSSWIVHARMNYNGRDFVIPIPVQVQWAGDTAVLIVDKLAMPGSDRTYSARVLFYDKTYAGTWSGGGSAGLLSGLISNEKPAESKQP